MEHYDLEITTLERKLEERENQLAEAWRNATEAMEQLNSLMDSSKELAEVLREHWTAPADVDAMTLYCTSILAGFARVWKENPPKNGFVHLSKFKGCEPLQIEVKRAEGESVIEAMKSLTRRAEAAEARVTELEAKCSR